jgi:ubiquinone biosynthesis monooxygenase Coq7
MTIRSLSPFDRAISEIERALSTVFDPTPLAERPSPAIGVDDVELDETQRRHAAGLMRVNHTGEVCAQALYSGQAAVARDEQTRAQLLAAAGEETDHLAWCGERLSELSSRPSLLNPFGTRGVLRSALCGAINDRVSLGFVVETEQQVEAHLGEHLENDADARSRVIVAQMQVEEARHGE